MKKGNWKVYVCRYAEQCQCECDFIVCQDCNNKNNSTRSRQYNTDNAPMLQDMFYPLLNKWTGEALCVGNQVEYHKLQCLKMSDSAHILISSWQNKKRKELQNKKGKSDKITFLVNAAKVVSNYLKLKDLDKEIW